MLIVSDTMTDHEKLNEADESDEAAQQVFQNVHQKASLIQRSHSEIQLFPSNRLSNFFLNSTKLTQSIIMNGIKCNIIYQQKKNILNAKFKGKLIA